MTDPTDVERYSYAWRKGVLPISWDDFFAICKGLARAVAPYDPQIVLGIVRGGLYPATLLSHMLRAEMYAMRVTSRFRDEVVHTSPIWMVRPPEIVADQRVLIVDEIASQGLTLQMAVDETRGLGAREVRSAVMYAHHAGEHVPDYIGIISDELILNPWDREIFVDGDFHPHPEYVGALRQQGIDPAPSFLLGIGEKRPEKATPGE